MISMQVINQMIDSLLQSYGYTWQTVPEHVLTTVLSTVAIALARYIPD